MSFIQSEECYIHQNLISLWIRQAVYFDGWFKVSNKERSYVLVNKGKYVFCDNGHIKYQRKSRESMEKILHGLVLKHKSFIRQGYQYYFSRGAWYRYILFEDDQC